jgi:hypothetical protein
MLDNAGNDTNSKVMGPGTKCKRMVEKGDVLFVQAALADFVSITCGVAPRTTC